MKTFVPTLVVLCAPALAHATIHTVSTRPGYPAQHATLAAAHTAAAAGDTIYLTPSSNTYGTQALTKQVTIIGGGHANVEFQSQVGTITFNAGSSGSRLIGVLAGAVTFGNAALTNILLERVQVGSIGKSGSSSLSGVTIRHCVISSLVLDANTTNLEIANNLFANTANPSTSISGLTSTSVLITNNVFMGTGNTNYRSLVSVSNALVTNNIFYGRAPAGGSVTNCTFDNNLTWSTIANALPPAGAGNTGSGNIENQNPSFTNVLLLNPTPAVAVTYDFSLQNGSPASESGTGGTDMGLYGGFSPLNVPLDGVPRIPLVTSFELSSPVISQSGSVDVEAEGVKHD